MFAPVLTPRLWATQALLVFGWNTLVAGMLIVFFDSRDSWATWAYANLIGFPIWALMSTVGRVLAQRRRNPPAGPAAALIMLFALVLGLTLGSVGADLLFDRPATSTLSWLVTDRRALGFALLASIISMLFWHGKGLEYRLSAEAAAQAEALQAQERYATEAHLKLLQAQIEPHFLFNTLGVLDSMIATAPEQARALLAHLNDYLRAALMANRAATGGADTHTLGA